MKYVMFAALATIGIMVTGAAATKDAEIPAVDPELTFYAPFEGTATASYSKGEPLPISERGLTYGKGLKGQAVTLSAQAGSQLKYHLKNNVDSRRGTVTLWYKPLWDDSTVERWRHLFGFATPQNRTRIGTGAIFLWYYGKILRGDRSDNADTYVSIRQPVDNGVWRHIAFTWDENQSRVYVNGQASSPLTDGYNPLAAAFKGDADKKALIFDALQEFTGFNVGCTQSGNQSDGMIDDLRIYSAPLHSEQVMELAAEYNALVISTPRIYFLCDDETTLRATVTNRSKQKCSVSWRVIGPDKKLIREAAAPVEISRAKPLEIAISLPQGTPGCYTLHVESENALPVQKDLWVMDSANVYETKAGPLDLELVETVTLDKEPGAERFVSTGGHSFRELNGTPYLEAGVNQYDRFAVRFHLPDAGPLYCFEYSYPDDKPRTADIIVQPSAGARHNYELQVGYATGDEYPCQNRMISARYLYWAPTQDVSVVFMTARQGVPAAVAQIRVYKVKDGLPVARCISPKPTNGWNRTMGLYFEDPAINFDFAVMGDQMPQFETMINRTAAYMKYSGQDLFLYPGVWYHGLIGENYAPRGHAESFLEGWYTRFDREGLGVMPTLNQHNVPLPEKLTLNHASLSDGSLLASPISIWETGKANPGGWHGTPPNFNILHPYVQKLVMQDIETMLKQGVNHPSFKGFDLRLAEHSLHWLGSIRAGYNDYMIDGFTEDTGIKVPVDRSNPMRGKLYAEWLLANARDEWVFWRCRAVAAWYKRIAARLAQARPDLRLSITCLTPLRLAGADYSNPAYVNLQNREAGVDAALFADTPNIIINQALRPARYRAGYDRKLTDDERLYLRDMFNRREFYSSLTQVKFPGVHLHDHYWESAVGNPDRRKKGQPALSAPWFVEEGWRVTTINPASFYAMRPYVIPLRYNDILNFTRGGFLIGTYGMEEFLLPFAQAFRALPAQRFADVPGSTAVVKVRSLQYDEKFWFYVVNTGEEAMEFAVTLDAQDVTDLITGASPVELKGSVLKLKLKPLQLRSFSTAGSAEIVLVAPLGVAR